MTNTLCNYRWTPVLFDDFRKEMNRLAEGFFDDAASRTHFAPAVNFADRKSVV